MNQNQNQKKNHKPAKTRRPKNVRPLRAVREYSAGGVVWRPQGDKIEILMIQDLLGRWSIPKGHVEPGEKIEQTAVREVSEETGLTNMRLGEKLDKIHFFYRREGKLIFMTTHVFLIRAMGDTSTLIAGDSEGIVDTKWFDADEAVSLVEYRDTKRLFQMALTKIKNRTVMPRRQNGPRRQNNR